MKYYKIQAHSKESMEVKNESYKLYDKIKDIEVKINNGTATEEDMANKEKYEHEMKKSGMDFQTQTE